MQLCAEYVISVSLFLFVLFLNYLVYRYQKKERYTHAQMDVWERFDIFLEDESLAQWIIDEELRGRFRYKKSEIDALIRQRASHSPSSFELERSEYW